MLTSVKFIKKLDSENIQQVVKLSGFRSTFHQQQRQQQRQRQPTNEIYKFMVIPHL